MEKDLEDLMKMVKLFCDRYDVDVVVDTFRYTLGGTHKVRIDIKKGD